MGPGDVADCERIWHEAFSAMRATHHLPPVEHSAATAERDRRRIAHLLATDPSGSFVAVEGDEVVGLAQAFVREGLWVLSLLGTAPSSQDRGVGRALVERALASGDPSGPGLILSSRDPRAVRRYARAGFAVHPAVTAWGRVQRRVQPPTPVVRNGDSDDLELAAAVDRRVRGASHGPDLNQLLDGGDQLLVLDDRGYAVARGGRPILLAAIDEDAAGRLLCAALARAGEEEIVEVNWLTAPQQWAVRIALDAGLELHPVGPVMVRGRPLPPHPYIPNGAYA